MTLTALDWSFIAAYFAVSLGVGLAFTRRAGRSTEQYFLGGRRVPWWLAGISIVATTFSADTPLLVTGITARGGIAGNWIWWAFALSGMLTVFFFARLWRRAGVTTDVELASIRYSGRPAHALRIFRALYLGLPINAVIGGGVTLGMVKILEGTIGVREVPAVLVCFGVTALYTTLGGFLGVLWTDFFQFLLAMTGSVVLAWYSVAAVGGLGAIPDGLARVHGPAAGSLLTFLPSGDTAFLPLVTLAAFLTVQWWAASYPGAEPGGGGYVAQRMFAARDERASVGAVLLFNVLHYTLRPWPWILTALAAAIYLAGDPAVAADPETGYVRMLTTVLPAGWRGVLLAALLAAYMSTVATQLNWGASYLVNDVYRPYVRPGRDDRHYVLAARVASLVIMALGGFVALRLGRVTAALDWLVSIGAGTGLVLILRWYWWRVNAWSEIAAMVAAGITSLSLQHWLGPSAFGLGTSPRDAQVFFAYSLVMTTGIVTMVWLAVTWLTPPTDMATLVAFYRRTRPGVAGWRPVAALAPEVTVTARPAVAWLHWALGCATIYLALFGSGQLLLGSAAVGVLLLGGAVVCGLILLRGLGRDEEVAP
jgi:Na+/proline symporter